MRFREIQFQDEDSGVFLCIVCGRMDSVQKGREGGQIHTERGINPIWWWCFWAVLLPFPVCRSVEKTFRHLLFMRNIPIPFILSPPASRPAPPLFLPLSNIWMICTPFTFFSAALLSQHSTATVFEPRMDIGKYLFGHHPLGAWEFDLGPDFTLPLVMSTF